LVDFSKFINGRDVVGWKLEVRVVRNGFLKGFDCCLGGDFFGGF
jgi:hypothetical protein